MRMNLIMSLVFVHRLNRIYLIKFTISNNKKKNAAIPKLWAEWMLDRKRWLGAGLVIEREARVWRIVFKYERVWDQFTTIQYGIVFVRLLWTTNWWPKESCYSHGTICAGTFCTCAQLVMRLNRYMSHCRIKSKINLNSIFINIIILRDYCVWHCVESTIQQW